MREYTGKYKVGDLKTKWFIHRVFPTKIAGEEREVLVVAWANFRVTSVGVTPKDDKDYEAIEWVYKHQYIIFPEVPDEVEIKTNLNCPMKDIPKYEISPMIQTAEREVTNKEGSTEIVCNLGKLNAEDFGEKPPTL